MLVSSPACEKTQISVVVAPLAGRNKTTGFPASVQVLEPAEKLPSAAMFRSTSSPGKDTPEVVGSTTTMSLPEAAGFVPVSVMLSSVTFGAATTSETLFDRDPSGFCNCTLMFSAVTTSDGNTGAVHSAELRQFVVREIPPMNTTDPGPGLVGKKPPT